MLGSNRRNHGIIPRVQTRRHSGFRWRGCPYMRLPPGERAAGGRLPGDRGCSSDRRGESHEWGGPFAGFSRGRLASRGATALSTWRFLIDEKMTATGSGACWLDVNPLKSVAVRTEDGSDWLPRFASARPAAPSQQVQCRRRRGEGGNQGDRARRDYSRHFRRPRSKGQRRSGWWLQGLATTRGWQQSGHLECELSPNEPLRACITAARCRCAPGSTPAPELGRTAARRRGLNSISSASDPSKKPRATREWPRGAWHRGGLGRVDERPPHLAARQFSLAPQAFEHGHDGGIGQRPGLRHDPPHILSRSLPEATTAPSAG